MKKGRKLSRRDFVGTVLGAAAAAGITSALKPLETLADQEHQHALPTRPLGRTGHQVGIFSLGGQATLEQSGTAEESVAIINRALDLGVNYIDTAAAYGRGQSERYIGAVMKVRRKEVFLASKTHSRSYSGCMRLLEESLKNLQTDHLDLWQLHNVRTQDDLNRIFAPDGAIKALEKARDEGTVRFLGITGHYDPFVLKKAIQEYPFDTVLMSLNAADKHNKSFMDNLLPVAVERKMGIIGMKIPARGRIFRHDGITSMEPAMRYVLTLPVSTIIVGISTMQELEEDIGYARKFRPMTEQEMRRTEELTKPYYAEATWFQSSW
jgi:predicted aldo/keto reductase-like oxidoreductase